MKHKIDEITSTTHHKYDEFKQEQYIVNLDVGDKVVIKIYGKAGQILDQKTFIAQYVNCHINCNWQDKGEKKL